jgi:hypothetical protein
MPKPSPIKGLTPPEKRYFWLVSGDVYFSVADAPEGVQQAQMNSILSTVAPVVNSAALANAQASLVQRLKDTDESVNFVPVNVVFHAISPLGHMSDEDFFGKQDVADAPPAPAGE